MTDFDDATFLAELARQLAEAPTDRISGASVAEAIGHEARESEPIVQRLKARGLVEWSPAPARGGDGWTTRGLALTAAGYERLGL